MSALSVEIAQGRGQSHERSYFLIFTGASLEFGQNEMFGRYFEPFCQIGVLAPKAVTAQVYTSHFIGSGDAHA